MKITSIASFLIPIMMVCFHCGDTLSATTLSPSQSALLNHPAPHVWNLQDADLLSVINEVSRETGKNFVIDPRVNGKITLIFSKPIRKKDIYQVFLSAIGLVGYSAIPSGNVIKIIPSLEGNELATAVASAQAPGHGDEVVIRVIPLQNVSAAQLMPVLRPLLPSWSVMSSYLPGNVLIILGRANNLKRLLDVIHQVDHASNHGVDLITLRHASASQVATILNNLENASRNAGENSTLSIATDERSNSILLGGTKSARLRVRILIAQLDAPSISHGNTEVIYLRYLEAKTFGPLLSKIAQNINSEKSSTAAAPGSDSGAPTIISKGKAEEPSMNIQAEPSTNAVIITAPPALMRVLKNVIVKLDICPAQVSVEAIIAEIDESNLANLGIQWGNLTANNNNASSNDNGDRNITDFPSLGAGVIGLIPGIHLKAVLSLLQNQNGVDILSTPSIMVLDNQKATIEVGQDVPYQSGSYSTTGGSNSVTPFTTNSYKPVTLQLEVTPQINLGHSVRLKLNIKNDTLQNPENPGLTPIIKTSKISNSVLVNSNDILVLGGLISHANNENINKVPILSDIPLLGHLFQQKIHNQQKKNLMIFLKPTIIQNAEEGMNITETKYNQIRRTQANFREDLADIGKNPTNTLLPPWRASDELPPPFNAPALTQ